LDSKSKVKKLKEARGQYMKRGRAMSKYMKNLYAVFFACKIVKSAHNCACYTCKLIAKYKITND